MAKKSVVERNKRRQRMVKRYAERRAELRAIAGNLSYSMEDRIDARQKLAKLPLNSNPNRMRNRCELTGRPRAYIRQFGLSRITFREAALQGHIPGIRKASW